MIFVGIDWSEQHHDIWVMNKTGETLNSSRVAESFDGIGELHKLIASADGDDSEVVVGIETDRGLLVESLVAAGYSVYAINPLMASRYRDRHHISGTKSDAADAKMLADLVRTDRHNHRLLAADTVLLDAIKVLARTHKNLIWDRQHHVNRLRSALREYFPAALAAFGTDLDCNDAVSVLGKAPTPASAKRLSTIQIAAALRRGGRQRNVDKAAAKIHEAFHGEQLETAPEIADAMGVATAATVAIIVALNVQIQQVETQLNDRFEEHPDAEILRSLPGLGAVLGARVLAEFGDDPNRYADAKARRNYAGTSPVTKASGKSRTVHVRYVKNARLIDALQRWAYCSLTASPGARAYYDALRARNKPHNAALRQLANRWVAILHGCLKHHTHYDEAKAWPAIHQDSDRAAA